MTTYEIWKEYDRLGRTLWDLGKTRDAVRSVSRIDFPLDESLRDLSERARALLPLMDERYTTLRAERMALLAEHFSVDEYGYAHDVGIDGYVYLVLKDGRLMKAHTGEVIDRAPSADVT